MAIGENFNEILNIYSQYNSWSEFVSAHPELASQFEAADFNQLVLSGVFNGWTEIVNLNNGAQGIVQGTAALQGALQPTTTYIYDAAQAIDQYIDANGNPTGGALPVWAAAAGFIPGIGKLSLAGLLGVGANVACCAAAAGIGFKIGTDIYETNPDFWQECYEAAYPWLFRGIDKALVVDYNGKTYLDSRLYEALKSKLNEILETYEGVAGIDRITIPEASDQSAGYAPINTVVNFSVSDRPVYYGDDVLGDCGFVYEYKSSNASVSVMSWTRDESSSPLVVFAAQVNIAIDMRARNMALYDYPSSGTPSGEYSDWYIPTVSSGTYTRDGRVVQYYFAPLYPSPRPDGQGRPTQFKDPSKFNVSPSVDYNSAESIGQIAWDIVYGGSEDISADWPEGVTRWDGQIPPDPYDGAIDVLILPDPPTYTPYIPIALPEWGAPALNPITNPNPQEYTNPEEQVRPYALPLEQPDGNPIPNVDSDSDPEQNPSSQPETAPSSSVPSQSKYPDSGWSPTNTPNITPPIFEPGSSNPSGLVNVYNPTPQELYSFGRWLWVTYTDVTIDKILNNPFDGVISLHEIYATPNRGARQVIRSGFLTSATESTTVPNRYSYINCGSIVIPEWYGNYLDYSPYTKAYLYLPFIGIEELDADDVIGAAVNVTYGVDSYSGACVAIVTTAREGYNAVTYQFTGNCAVEHPITGGTQAQNLIAILQGTIGAAASAATSNFGGMFSAAFDITKSKSTVSHSGKFGANFGAMACKKPYLIIKRPNQVVVPNYNEFYGYPAHKYVVIGSCTGYLRCKEVHVNSARATDEEKARIEELLKAGVYVS